MSASAAAELLDCVLQTRDWGSCTAVDWGSCTAVDWGSCTAVDGAMAAAGDGGKAAAGMPFCGRARACIKRDSSAVRTVL